ncbi:MAG: AAA family ATPase [Gaiellaceae bacterium]
MKRGSVARGLLAAEEQRELSAQWRSLRRVATGVAILSAPAVFIWLQKHERWSVGWSLVATLLALAAFRGLLDLLFHRFIQWPSLFGIDNPQLREEDVVARRRVWFWHFWAKVVYLAALLIVSIYVIRLLRYGFAGTSFLGTGGDVWHWFAHTVRRAPKYASFGLIFVIYFIFNFGILMGPMLFMGISQIRGFEPGDADWGVKLKDVRGQAEAKEEVRRVVSLWQSGEAFERAGGKRERGLLFLGAPGTGKTMLAKAIATGFNSPIVTIPGSGFAQTFIGMDVIIVRWLARKAKKLARKWGGQCIVFIDEIDAVGMRRQSLGGASPTMSPGPPSFHDLCFFGPKGALNASEDLILESRAWRDRLFAERKPEPPARSPFVARVGGIVNQAFPGGMFGGSGQLALNQLLLVMDGIDNPPFLRRAVTNRMNTMLDALYVIPPRLGRIRLRVAHAKPSGNQIYFIGATNVPMEMLDPALTRPGRMGRHVWFRTPTKTDRHDIFDLYLDKVSHEEDLDTEKRRDELARVTNGYAQPLYARVLTPFGWRAMGELDVGDEVIGSDGKPTTVVGVHPRGKMDVYRVTLNDGTSTECTADHLWTLDALDPRMARRTFPLQELVDRKLRWSPRGSRFYLPKLAAVEFSAASDLPIDPYLLGFMLGDGGLAGTTPDICSADEESVARVGELVPAGVSLVQHGPRNWWISSGRRGGRPNPLTESFRTVGLWGHTSHTKFIPDAYKLASVKGRLSLVQGLLDTDGSIDYRRGTGAEFYTASRRLAEDVAEVVRSLGGLARVKPKGDGWRVAIELLQDDKPFRLTRKATVHRLSKRPFHRRITGVEPVGRREVRCITVANEDGLYVTDGFIVTHNSPAMIEQVCSMALTIAHHDGRLAFGWPDIVEAMTTVESGTAVGTEYVPEETRAVAIHEAGHAAAAHVYLKGAESTRLSIKRRGAALGHHQAREKEERFSSWRSEEMAQLIWALGAMAAERVFYGENSTGVGGDVQSATARAAWMVGACGMAPEPVDVTASTNGRPTKRTLDQRREEISRRFQEIGTQIMNRTGNGGPLGHDPLAGVLNDRDKRALAAQLLGQAYVTAHALIAQNKGPVEKIADELIKRRELFGDELVEILEKAKLKAPKMDLTTEASWPVL